MVQSISFVDANRDDDARSCPSTVVHACIWFASQSLSSPLVPALDSCRQNRKYEKNETYGQRKAQRNPFRRNVIAPPSPSRIKLSALLSRSRLSLLPANRQSRRPLASGGLCFRSCCFVVVVYPDVWLKPNPLLV